MGKVTRRRYTADFKAKVALEAIRGELTLAELAAKHGIHQTMIAAWKKQAVEGMAATFSGKAEAVQATVEGPITPTVPASILQQHPRCFLQVDREAASLLRPCESLAK